ncbi:SDR family NAD(P)-dependent oxidoreductase [Budvicia aquatica]|uniref:3-oxoacyl-[acyl-carrier-protein] reductase FabG n=1 Tax=Budvicia aquatica TaxID=82979 RepID=A0A2C6DUZ4_9GAMM|nr:SDR family NAD(P)-dependent oxidoreductase [Budvicia aquatica]PHI32295.1 NAD(P)-dependent oxidoreductase [Budvicia aquatica]GKX52160.1 oxidoreductase [Budvicia aquatica]VFS45229.1 3-oxoacyl-[acyl-carrier-protein] reductase FabG [Budvicia aquatica]
MFNDLKGKRILITGSTSGIGLATAKAFARSGAKVGINSYREESCLKAMEQLKPLGGEVAYFVADVSKSEDCQTLVNDFVERFGGIDVLINNAGGLGGRNGLEAITDEFYDHVMNLNARSAMMVTKYSIPHLRAAAKASGQTTSVISSGSIAGREGGGPGASLYASSKAWLHSMHRNWVKELTKDNIRFNVVAPGSIDTAFHSDKSPELIAKIGSTIPMGRFGTSEEVAPSYLFLASHACSGYITGQIIDVNGGQMAP